MAIGVPVSLIKVFRLVFHDQPESVVGYRFATLCHGQYEHYDVGSDSIPSEYRTYFQQSDLPALVLYPQTGVYVTNEEADYNIPPTDISENINAVRWLLTTFMMQGNKYLRAHVYSDTLLYVDGVFMYISDVSISVQQGYAINDLASGSMVKVMTLFKDKDSISGFFDQTGDKLKGQYEKVYTDSHKKMVLSMTISLYDLFYLCQKTGVPVHIGQFTPIVEGKEQTGLSYVAYPSTTETVFTEEMRFAVTSIWDEKSDQYKYTTKMVTLGVFSILNNLRANGLLGVTGKLNGVIDKFYQGESGHRFSSVDSYANTKRE